MEQFLSFQLIIKQYFNNILLKTNWYTRVSLNTSDSEINRTHSFDLQKRITQCKYVVPLYNVRKF